MRNARPVDTKLSSASNVKGTYWGVFNSLTKGYNSRVIAGASNRLLNVNDKITMGTRGHSDEEPDRKNFMRKKSIPEAVTRKNGIMKFRQDGFSRNDWRRITDPQNEIRYGIRYAISYAFITSDRI